MSRQPDTDERPIHPDLPDEWPIHRDDSVAFGLRGWVRWGWRQLTSMRTALILLFLLAVAAIPGSLLPQRNLNPQRVAEYFRQYPDLAPVLDRLGMFDVFAAPWFAAIYLLLFISLAGCVIPRTWRHAVALLDRPPAAPRHLSRLPYADRWETEATPAEAVAAARAELAGLRFRTETDSPDGRSGSWVAAEKGYLRETGNLLFHLALLALLFAVAAGALFGYRGNILVVEGDGFANTVAAYDKFDPGRVFDPRGLQPFSLHLERFQASYITSGPQRGQPQSFQARLRYRPDLESPERTRTLEVNHPLEIDGAKVYLLGHGYAPTFEVRDGAGRVAFSGAVPFLPQDQATFTSEGVVKVPDAQPKQLGFSGFFTPTTVRTDRGITSSFPAATDPAVTLLAQAGDLGLDGGFPQSVYQLDTRRLTRLKAELLRPGDTMTLPDNLGSITFTGYREWASLQVTYDPGRVFALATAALAVIGLVVTLGMRRRRVWVRATPGEGGRTVVEAGGLPRADAGGGFAEEFSTLAGRLRSVTRAETSRAEE
ncbi:MAG: cytochrome c biogenesis protein ResB [Streptosporangiales bacterium]|nr:cytochrome c biogenesis protein ResB [Streptosporangiales bacterium]